MEVYNKEKTQIISDYDLSKGRLERDERTIYHEAVKEVVEQFHYEVVKGKYKKSDKLTEQMAEFLVKAIVKEWTITFEFQNGYKATKEYTNGRAGNVNGKLCKH